MFGVSGTTALKQYVGMKSYVETILNGFDAQVPRISCLISRCSRAREELVIFTQSIRFVAPRESSKKCNGGVDHMGVCAQ